MSIKVKRRTHQKLFYIPGFYSLCTIALLLFNFSIRIKFPQQLTVIPVQWYDPKLKEKYPEIFSGKYPPDRNYLNIQLTGDDNTDKIKVDYFQLRLREILERKDTIHGIHITFYETAKYWTFIKVLNICDVEQALTFFPYEDDFYVYHISEHETQLISIVK